MRTILLASLVAIGCGEAHTPQPAEWGGDDTTACSDDANCMITIDECVGVMWCSHRDRTPPTTDIVCEPADFYIPEDAGCVCQDTCTAVTLPSITP